MSRARRIGCSTLVAGIALQAAACFSADAMPAGVGQTDQALVHDAPARGLHRKHARRHEPRHERPCDAGQPETVDAATDASMPEEEQAQLPPWLTYCTPETACATDVTIKTCPDSADCATTGRRTTLTWTLDGASFNGNLLLVNPHGVGVSLVSSSPYVTSYGAIAAIQGAAAVGLIEGQGTDVNALSYYDIPPQWGGVTELKFVSLSLPTARGTAWFYRHTSFDYGLSVDALSEAVDSVYDSVVALTGRTPPVYRAFFMPSEMVASNGDGNFAFLPDTVTVNYGNPDWLRYIGGFQTSLQWEWSHELTHLLIQPLMDRLSDVTCLNEGLADAVGNKLGYIPESDFRPSDSTLESSCRQFSDSHGIGNCYLWHLKHYRASADTDGPLWNARTFAGLFAAPRPLPLNTCSLPAPGQTVPEAQDLLTGDAWVVYFSDATGEDMTELVQRLGFFTSGSLAASLAALGF